jgi:hypothetical protein
LLRYQIECYIFGYEQTFSDKKASRQGKPEYRDAQGFDPQDFDAEGFDPEDFDAKSGAP